MKKSLIYLLAALIAAAAAVLVLRKPDAGLIPPKTMGGLRYDSARDIIRLKNGSYVIAGMTTSYGIGHVDALWALLDRSGSIKKKETYGGKKDDRIMDITRLNDGSYVMTGFTTSYGQGDKDILLIKTNKKSRQLFLKTYGGAGIEEGECVIRSNDGGYVICGTASSFGMSNQDFYIISVDNKFNIRWSGVYGGEYNDFLKKIIPEENGHYTACGYTNSTPDRRFAAAIISVDSSGNCVWSRTYGGKVADMFMDIIKSGNKYYAVGESGSKNDAVSDVMAAAIDEKGALIWKRIFGGPRIDRANRIIRLSDGNLLIGGITESMGNGSSDVYLIKITPEGEKIWERTYGGRADEYTGNILEEPDSSIAVIGWTASYGKDYEIMFFRANSNGRFY